MDNFRPVIITIVNGLALRFWKTDSLQFPVIIVNNSEAEEAEAALALFSVGRPDVHVVSSKIQSTRSVALARGLKEASALGYTHALTLVNPFEEKSAIDCLVNCARRNPNAFIEASKEDLRRVWPIHETICYIKEKGEGLDFEQRFVQEYLGTRIKVSLPGKASTLSLQEKICSILGSFTRKILR